MYTLAKRIGSTAFVGLAVLGFAAREAPAQNNPLFRAGIGQPAAQPAGGVARPNAGVGFNYNAYGAPGTILNSPYTASMTSSGSGGYGDSNPYGGGYGSYIMPDPFSGYLRGTADVINAQGKYLVNTQQAYLMKEQVRGAQLDNRRRLFDEWLYERANTPSLNDVREKEFRDEVRRSRNDPPLTEIWSAKALNDLLADAQKLQGKAVKGPNIPIDEELLKQINLSNGVDGSNFGLLKNEGKLNWPLALRDLEPAADSRQLRQDLQALITKAYNEAKDNKAVDAGTLREIDATTKKMHDMLVKNVGAVPFAQYSDAKSFLRQLDDGIKVLRKGEGAQFINGGMALKGNTVGEVVEFMTKKGLQFAPATGNGQAAYVALHRALAAYDGAVNNLAAERDR